jgi:hypothetical protein
MNTNLQAWHAHLTPGKALEQQAFALRSRVPSFSIQIHQVDMLKFDIPIKHYDLIIATTASHLIDAE